MKSKFLFIFLVVLILLNIFTVYSSASFDFKYNDKLYSLPDFKHFDDFIIWQNGSVIDIWSFSDFSDVRFKLKEGDYNFNADGSYPVGVYSYWVRIDSKNNVSYLHDNKLITVSSSFGGNGNLLYSTVDLKDFDGNVVFQRPVPTLGEVLEITNPVKTFQITINGMIVFLAVFLVSLVGFWKAWSILLNSLRKA